MEARDDQQFERLAAIYGTSGGALRDLIADLQQRSGAASFYIFWNTSRDITAPSGAARQRRLIAFPTPDAALAFVQHHHLASPLDPPRLRRLSLLQLVQALLREPRIVALILADDNQAPPPAGHLPPGLLLDRADLLRRLSINPDRETAHEQSL